MIQALGDLMSYAKRSNATLAPRYFGLAKKCLAQFERAADSDWLTRVKSLAQDRSSTEYIKFLALTPLESEMVKLYWFFRHECGLQTGECEVRAALIRNCFWTKHGVRAVKIRQRYQDGETRGCDAVRRAVERFRPEKGTSH